MASTADYPNSRVLCSGMFGLDIAWVQETLNLTSGQGLDVNGHFTLYMSEVVINFQNFWDLTPDGIVGPETYEVLHFVRDWNEV